MQTFLRHTFKHDLNRLANTKLPIITVSASWREDLKAMYGLPDNEWLPDIVFSRAHYSMAMGIAVAAWGDKVDPHKAWLVDPTNYVSSKDWQSIIFTQFVGKTLARQPFLKRIKDFIDHFGRNKLPILSAITPPLLEITKKINQPILSLHIAAGNILAANGKTIVQVITDPHVREDYLNYAHLSSVYFCVFDEKTKYDLIEKAHQLNKKVDPNRIIVTGPPVDPRIVAARKNKNAWRSGKLKLCITTGGLGTNKYEIRQLLRNLLPFIKQHPNKLALTIFAGTQTDIQEMVAKLAQEFKIKISPNENEQASLRLLYHPQVVDANELLINYAFPWADGFITKPSGDMAYDAVAAGCFLLTLREWGVWEENIEEVFEQLGIAREAKSADQFIDQLQALTSASGKSSSWIESAMRNAENIDPLFLEGAQNIIKAYKSVVKTKKN